MKKVHDFICLSGFICSGFLGFAQGNMSDLTYIAAAEGVRGGDIKHVVQQKQTLYGIARTYNVLLADLKAYNHLTGDGIKIGQVLMIPPAQGVLRSIDMASPVVAAPKVVTPSAPAIKEGQNFYYTQSWKPYTVEAGESLESIASKLNVSLSELRTWNDNITNDQLHVGDNLKVNPEQVPVYLSPTQTTPVPAEATARVVTEPVVEIPSVNVQPTITAVLPPSFDPIVTAPIGVGTPEMKIPTNEPSVSLPPVVQTTTTEPYVANVVAPVVSVTGANTETGTFFVVENKALTDKYYVYHKSLPIGTKVKVHIPNNGGYMEAKVVARTRADRTEIIGVCPTIKRILGVATTSPIKITY